MIQIRSYSTSAFRNLKAEASIIENNLFLGQAVLFFYENAPAVILGKYQDPDAEVYARKKRYPVYHRLSGGGAVVHAPDILNYSLILPMSRYPQFLNIEKSYSDILGGIINSFRESSYANLNLRLAGISDICLHQRGECRKISGNSQARKKARLLHHGTFICKRPPDSLVYTLRPPAVRPEYRQNKTHRDFIIQFSPFGDCSHVRKIITKAMEKLIGEKITDMSGIFHHGKFHTTV